MNSNGSLDSAFTTGTAVARLGPVELYNVIPQADGKMLITGIFHTYNGRERGSIVRLLANGSVDETYQSGTGAMGVPGDEQWPGQLGSADLLDGGRLLLSGGFDRFNGQAVSPPIILNADGTRDPHFAGTLVDLGGIGPTYAPITGAVWGGAIHFVSGYGLGRLRMDVPLRIVSHTHDGQGTHHVTANALAGRTYTLQGSATLTNWIDLSTQPASTNRIEFTDAPTNSPAPRFYRVKQN